MAKSENYIIGVILIAWIAFFPYYRLLNFQISNYAEEVDNGDIGVTEQPFWKN